MFIRSFFDRCFRQYGCSNEVSLVIYSRLYYPQVTNESELKHALRRHHSFTSSSLSNHLQEQGAFMKSQHRKFF